MDRHPDTSGPGQGLEFEIWADLIKQSQGSLHVFLPLLDRGLDAVLHRMTEGATSQSRSKDEARRSRGWWRS